MDLYRYALNDPVNFIDPEGLKVYLVHGPNELGSGEKSFHHYWIKTEKYEKGMGLTPSGRWRDGTQWVDHTGRHKGPNVEMLEIPGADEGYINNQFEENKNLGLWVPPINYCKTAAVRLLNEARYSKLIIDYGNKKDACN